MPDRGDDHQHLTAVLTLAGCGARSGCHATAMLADGRSLGAAFALDGVRLRRLGIPDGGVHAVQTLRAVMLASLRREANDRPVVDGEQAALDYLHLAMGHLGVEEFRVLYLNKHRHLIKDEVLGEGTVDSCPVNVRRVIVRALDLGASGMVLVHNHPSGSLVPSRDDVTLTKSLIAAARCLDIQVYDHLIICSTGHTSMRALGQL